MKKFAFVLAWLGLLATLFTWAFASPVGASPDEDFHLVSIYCTGYTNPDMCEQSSVPNAATVSSKLLESNCFAGDATKSAACQFDNKVFTEPHPMRTTRGNFQGTYPPLFYLFMNQFAGDDVLSSVLNMRFFNVTLFAGMLAAIAALAPTGIRFSVQQTIALTMVPLGLFFCIINQPK